MKLVLVIDGAADVRSRMAVLVRAFAPQARVLEAQNGKDGVLLAVSEQPDLIFLGSELPIMNGYEAAYRLRSMPRTRKIPLIAVHGREPQAAVSDGLGRLANGAVSPATSTGEFGHLLRDLGAGVADAGEAPRFTTA